LKTTIYIDGYNLYYGCLKYSPYKWLDLYQLFARWIVHAQMPESQIDKIKFFTADIKSKFSSQGDQSQQAQERYHRALSVQYTEQIEIIKGFYALDYASLPRYQKPVNLEERAEVWRLEEKQTDVNIALHGYRDVMQGRCDQLVLVSNDTDLEGMLQMIREDRGDEVEIGVVIPIIKHKTGNPDGRKSRPANERLSKYANWTRHHILEEELERSQLPEMIPTKKKPIAKPSHW